MTDARARAKLPKDFTPLARAELESTIPARFARIVAQHADRLAIDDGTRTLTYSELDAASNGVARELVRRLGGDPEPVALLYRHGAPFHVAQLGVSKSGKFFASLDSELSPARLSLLLANLGPRLVLCDARCEPLARDLAAALPGSAVLNTEAIEPVSSLEPAGSRLTPSSVAYVVYTSGSTGPPEGVVLPHRHVLHAVLVLANGSRLRSVDRCSQVCPLSSAAAMNEVFSTLLNGSALFPFAVKSEGVSNVMGLSRWLRRNRITVTVCVPVLFRLLAAALGRSGQLPDLRLLRLSGDRILVSDIELFKKHFPGDALLRVAYGASECNVATELFIDHEYDARRPNVPAGYPIEDSEVFIVDEEGNRLGPGQRGEIAVRSRYNALGYWRNPKRTEERFLADAEDPETTTYFTRDLGYFEDDGCLVHLGRTDFRVKVYGKWVAVTDIEEALLGVPGVSEAVVVAQDGQHGNTLVAYYTERPGASLTNAELLAALDTFPPEVVPKEFVRLDEMPVTASNKIDRKRLAAGFRA